MTVLRIAFVPFASCGQTPVAGCYCVNRMTQIAPQPTYRVTFRVLTFELKEVMHDSHGSLNKRVLPYLEDGALVNRT